jgi:hypothetical protein
MLRGTILLPRINSDKFNLKYLEYKKKIIEFNKFCSENEWNTKKRKIILPLNYVVKNSKLKKYKNN